MRLAGLVAGLALLAGCQGAPAGENPAASRQGASPENPSAPANPVIHFEIPVADMDRAVAFYEAVFAVTLERRQVDGYDMAFFPRAEGGPGASGALARGDVYRPTRDGAILYFDVADIDAVIARVGAHGGTVLYPKKDIGEAGFVAEIADSEGNRIALSQAPAS
jgi:predicted enzyme related to lactoylglutathione lyase